MSWVRNYSDVSMRFVSFETQDVLSVREVATNLGFSKQVLFGTPEFFDQVLWERTVEIPVTILLIPHPSKIHRTTGFAMVNSLWSAFYLPELVVCSTAFNLKVSTL